MPAPFEWNITPLGASPIFRQIADQVRLGAATGRLSAGDPLPSVRGLAERLLINPNTVARAYGELAREGIIESQPGRGVFIATPRAVYTRAERLRRIAPLVQSLINEGLSLGFSAEEIVDLVEQKLGKINLPTSRGKS
ncbi:MAG TPA: GntR family transcriptional regulator [Tepidisphaeraceae bacterium]|jgi:GntR family transcriptional regulator|nr:GntR family transcriptional regulator [Tepidisphaeraceae bacterium]